MVPVSGTLTANEPVTWSKSGTDAARVTLNPATGAWSLETTDFETKASYAWTFTATDLALNATNQNVAITITDVDEIPAAFAFTDVTGGTVSTQYTSNAITVSGLAAGVSVPVAVSGGTYSKNGGAYTGSAGTATNGDTFAVRQTSSASNSTATNVVLTIGGVSDTYTVTTAAVGGTFAVNFGALISAGSGGYPVSGTAISSGDASGHWQIASGILCPSTAGDTANLNLGPYTLILNNGDTINVTIDANAWDVRTQSEWNTVIAQSAATLFGKTIYIRPDSYRSGGTIVTGIDGVSANLKRADFGGLTIQGRTPALTNGTPFSGNGQTITPKVKASDVCTMDAGTATAAFFLRGVKNVTFRHLAFPEVAKSKFSFLGESLNHQSGLLVDQCYCSGQICDPNDASFSTSTNYPNYGVSLIKTTGSATGSVGSIAVTNCLVQWGSVNIDITVDQDATQTSTVTGNEIRYFYEDGVDIRISSAQAVDCVSTVSDNVIWGPLGKDTDSALPHPDCIHFVANTNTTTDWHINVHRNIMFKGNARGDPDGLLANGFKIGAADSGHFFIASVTGNMVSDETAWGLSIENGKDCVFLNNTAVAWSPDSGGTVTTIAAGAGSTNSTTSGTHRLERNIAESFSIGGTPTLVNNITLGNGGVTIPYATVFDGPTFAPTTVAEVLQFFARKAGGPADLAGTYDAGAVGSSAVLFATSMPGAVGTTLVS